MSHSEKENEKFRTGMYCVMIQFDFIFPLSSTFCIKGQAGSLLILHVSCMYAWEAYESEDGEVSKLRP